MRVESGTIRHLLTVRFDPVERRIVAWPFYDTPLEPEVRYRLTIEDVRDLDGRALTHSFVARFETGSELGDPHREPEGQWAEVAPLFRARCATAGCHAGPAPILGMDLSSPEAVRATVIGVRSRQLPSAAVDASRGGLGFGGLSRVEVVGGVGLPEESYLVYKILGDPHVEGDPMPPPSAAAPLSAAEIDAIARWIRSGAPTE